MSNTDHDWERWGAQDPYFGVYSDDRFRRQRLTEDARTAFFASGEQHVGEVFDRLRRHFPDATAPIRAVDFGCGVGRLAIPMARRVAQVVGVDISPSMLAEAARNRDAAGCDNLVLALADDALSALDPPVDLAHSHIVLQHVPWSRGRGILQTLAGRVAPGGLLHVQLLVRHRGGGLARAFARLRYAIRPLHWTWNLARGRPLRDPPMQLHMYDLQTVLADLVHLGFECRHELDPWEGVDSCYVVARRRIAG